MIEPFTKVLRKIAVLDSTQKKRPAVATVDDRYNQVAPGKAVTLKLHMHTPVLMTGSGSSLLDIELANEHTGHTALQVTRDLMTVTTNKPSYVPSTNISLKQMHTTKRMVVVYKTYSSSYVVTTENTILRPDPKAIGAVHAKRFVDRDTQMKRRRW